VKGAKIFDLTGHAAIVTGGSVGLGQQMDEGLAKMGANLVLCGRKKERCQQAAAELEKGGTRALALGCDVKDPNSIQAIVDATGAHQRCTVLYSRLENPGAILSLPKTSMENRSSRFPIVDGKTSNCS
jgi:NAD(P)-dependent dehydrogenase (short-subunit alcohol dehydrogenase family)